MSDCAPMVQESVPTEKREFSGKQHFLYIVDVQFNIVGV